MKWWKRFVCLFKSIILKSSVIRVFNVEQDKVEGGGIRQFLSRTGDQNSLYRTKQPLIKKMLFIFDMSES